MHLHFSYHINKHIFGAHFWLGFFFYEEKNPYLKCDLISLLSFSYYLFLYVVYNLRSTQIIIK